MQTLVDSLRSELSAAIEQGREPWEALTQARLSAKLAASEAAATIQALEQRAADAERKLEHISPLEHDEIIASLRKAFHEASDRMHERSTAVVQREMQGRIRAEEELRAVRARHGLPLHVEQAAPAAR